VTEQCTDTKMRKVSYKFNIMFILVFIAIVIPGEFYLRHLEYEGGLANQPGRSFFPGLCFMAVVLLLLLFCSIRFLIRVFLPPRTIKHILIKIACVVVPFAIFFGSFMITTPLAPVFLKGFEKWVLKEVDIKAIQQWLITEGNQYKGKYYFDDDFPKNFPACLTISKPKRILFDNSEIDGSLYIELVYGGGMDSWGLRIGPPSMKTPQEGMVKITKYYYEYRRPISPCAYIFDGG